MPDFPTNGEGRDTLAMAFGGAAHDSAALLLIESLIHGLIARSILTVKDAIEIIDIAADAEREMHDVNNPSNAPFVSFLNPLSRSLQGDLHD